MRKRVFIGLLSVALFAASTFPLIQSKAARAPQPKAGSTSRVGVKPATLPNYDIRLGATGEFMDIDLSSDSNIRSASQNPDDAIKSRATAVENFRAGLSPDKAQNVHAIVNESGAMKNFFIDGARLSEPRSDTPDNIARSFLGEHGSLFALPNSGNASLKLNREDLDRGTTFIDYSQLQGGIKVFEGNVQVVVNGNGEVLSVREGFLMSGQKVRLRPSLTEAQGIAKAFEHAGRTVAPTFVELDARTSNSERSTFANPLGTAFEDVLSELNVIRIGDTAHLAWHVYADVGPNEWYEILVDAHSGELLLRNNLYVFDAQGTVYTEDPTNTPVRTLVSFVGDTGINTAAGWMGTSTVTTGNNVEAYLDTDANNSPDNNNGSGLSVGHASSATQDFTFPFSTAVDPRTQQAAVVTNLFYFNNVMHDFSYPLGFTETARNFQTNNYGRGGVANDSVRAEAQDGSGTNNANFATPPDGQRPRMQQYLFTAPNPDRDSSMDSDVVFHEFGHGISNRLIGNGSTALSGTQSGAMGEGWSDYWATTINNDGAVGEYVVNNAIGIRRAVYTVPAAAVHNSYADVGAGGFEVHNDGEVWAVTLWHLRTQLGAATTNNLVLNGMKFTPNRPSFLNARDGILQADQNLFGGANRCAIWSVFATHGMGVSAVGNDGTTHTAASDVPGDCGGTCTYSISPSSASVVAGGGTGSVAVTAGVGCAWTATSNATFITITSGSSGSGNGSVGYSVAANAGSSSRVGTMTIAGQTFTVTQAGTGGGGTQLITNTGFETGTAPWIVSGQTVRSTGVYPHSGTAYMILGAVNSSSSTLYQTVTIPGGSSPNLNFWLNITTSEAPGTIYDRLFIEVRSTTGTLLATLATFSNVDSGTAGIYVLRGAYNLSSFAGQTVRIQFRATTDISLPTSFRVDDVSVQ